MNRTDREKMVDFISRRLPDGGATLVLASGPGGSVTATVAVRGDGLDIESNCPEWVSVREVYDHLRWAAMPAWEQRAWLRASAPNRSPGVLAPAERAQLDRIEAMLVGLSRPPDAPGLFALTDRERDILEAVGGGKMTGEAVATASGYGYDGHFKTLLASLVKRGLLANDRPGYRRPQSGLGQD